MIRSILSFLILLLSSTSVLSAHLPPGVQSCKLSDENVQKCFKENGERAIKALKNGNEELKMPSADPLSLPPFKIHSQPGPMSIEQEYTNVVLKGLSNTLVDKFLVNLDNCAMYLEGYADLLEIITDYWVKGQMIIIPVDIKGRGHMKFKSTRSLINMTCEIFKNGGEDYIRLTSFKYVMKVKEFEMDLGNLTQGNEMLQQNVQNVINDNPFAFFDVAKSTVEDMWSKVSMDGYNKLFTNVPLKEIFQTD